MTACLRLIVFISLQIIVANTYPFQDDNDIRSRYVDQPEANSMDADLTSLLNANNRQATDNAQQNLDSQMLEVPNKEKPDQEQEALDSLPEQDAEREGGEYKEEENLGNNHLIEGDIYVDKTPITFSDNGVKRDALTNTVRLWPGGKVPYMFNASVSHKVRTAFRDAIADYNKYTCIRIVPRTSEQSYIHVVSEGGCWSLIGRNGGTQKLSLGSGCEYKGVAIHELMHALGFYHEQSRMDRDSYIRINWGNIMYKMDYNFKKYPHGQADTLGEPYDYASIMHYPKKAFSKNGRNTIDQIKSGPSIGQRSGFSSIDIKQINKLYKCNGVVVPTKRPTKPGSCRDDKRGCPRWANKYNYCVTGRYIAYMKKYCKKSCKLCNGTVNPECYDFKRSCPGWARRGFCNGRYGAYMTKNCPKSCKKC